MAIPREMRLSVLTAIVDHWKGARYGPTVEEIRQAVGLNHRSSVQWHITNLIQEGYLERVPRKHRSVHATKRGEALVELLNGDT